MAQNVPTTPKQQPLYSPVLSQAIRHRYSYHRKRTPRTIMKLMQQHRESERYRHQSLNTSIQEISKRIPGFEEACKETKIVMLQRIIHYICHLEGYIQALCDQMELALEFKGLFLSNQLPKDAECKLLFSPAVRTEQSAAVLSPTEVQESGHAEYEDASELGRNSAMKISSPTIDSTTFSSPSVSHEVEITEEGEPANDELSQEEQPGILAENDRLIEEVVRNMTMETSPLNTEKMDWIDLGSAELLSVADEGQGQQVMGEVDTDSPWVTCTLDPGGSSEGYTVITDVHGDEVVREEVVGFEDLPFSKYSQQTKDDTSSDKCSGSSIHGEITQGQISESKNKTSAEIDSIFTKSRSEQCLNLPREGSSSHQPNEFINCSPDVSNVHLPQSNKSNNEYGLQITSVFGGIDLAELLNGANENDFFSSKNPAGEFESHEFESHDSNTQVSCSPLRSKVQMSASHKQNSLDLQSVWHNYGIYGDENVPHHNKTSDTHVSAEDGSDSSVEKDGTTYSERAQDEKEISHNQIDGDDQDSSHRSDSVEGKVDLRRTSWMNGFMMYSRMHRREFIQSHPGVHTSQISKKMGHAWRKLSPTDQEPYKEKAKEYIQQVLNPDPSTTGNEATPEA